MIKYQTKTFATVFPKVDDFILCYNEGKIPALLEEKDVHTLYYLLYARYANSPIANLDENQWKYKMLSVIFQYGPAWVKRLEIQAKIRGLTDEEIIIGSKAIYNRALNPDTIPSTKSLEELERIDEQNTTNYKKSKLEAYSMLMENIRVDVSEVFLQKFDKLFLTVVANQYPAIYESEEEDYE